MIEAVEQSGTDYSSAFNAAVGLLSGPDVGWLQKLREAALEQFTALDFPTTKDEDWRFTDVRAIVKTGFELAAGPSRAVTSEALGALPFAEFGVARAVFVDGHFVAELSSLAGLGCRVEGLRAVLLSDPDRLRESLERHAETTEHAFGALNTAFMQDGAAIEVSDGVDVSEALHLVFVSTSSETPTRSHPRNTITVGRGSRLQVIETHVGVGSGVYLSNPVTELVVGEGASVDHVMVQHESPNGYHVGSLHAEVGREASLTTHSMTLTGALVRNDLRCVLAGEGAEAGLNGLYVARGSQHVDNHTQIDHASANCSSREVYKGILTDTSRGVFHGRVHVHKDAQDTDSKQSNNNLLLSEDARINTKPQLEIYADQVKCTHGATIGQLDEGAVFYMRARGIGAAEARSLLIYAFANEIVGHVRLERLRGELERFLYDWLPHGDAVKEAVEA